MSQNRPFAATAAYLAVFASCIVLVALAMAFDHVGTRMALKPAFAAASLVGIPLALAVAAFRRRHAAVMALMALLVVSAVYVAMALACCPSFAKWMHEDAGAWWSGVGALLGVSLLLVLALAAMRREGRVLGLVAALVALSALALLARDRLPEYEIVMQEDATAEWATFYAFALAGLVLGASCWRWWRGREPDDRRGLVFKAVATGVALFCLAVAGEEISWGQRLLAFKPPDFFLDANYQQEANIHNFLMRKSIWGIPVRTTYTIVYVCIVFGLILPLAALAARIVSGAEEAARRGFAPSYHFIPWIVLVALAAWTHPLTYSMEAAELVLGFVFLGDALLRLPRFAVPSAAGRRAPLLVAALFLPIALGAVTPVTVDRLIYGPSVRLAAEARQELEHLRVDLLQALTVEDEELPRIPLHQRLFTSVRRGHVSMPATSRFLEGATSPATDYDSEMVRTDRRGYFLDPWNNPLWVRYVAERGMLVYSFGPNRRRDTAFDGLTDDEWNAAQLSGDDIGVYLPPAEAP